MAAAHELTMKPRAIVFAACGVSLALGLFFIFVWSPLPWGWHGIDFYYEDALSLAGGSPFQTMDRVWGYAYFLAGFYRLFGDRPWIPLCAQALRRRGFPWGNPHRIWLSALDTPQARRCNLQRPLRVLQRRHGPVPTTTPQPERLSGRGNFVNKTELIELIAKQADISKAAATRALEAMIGGVRTTLKKGGSVSLVGFGTFAVTKRAARSGRNPRTGAAIKIKAAKVPKFRPGKALRDALN